jgi:hypothetical protein
MFAYANKSSSAGNPKSEHKNSKKVHEEPHCLYTLNYHVQTGKKRYNSNKAKSSKATKRVEIS